MKFTVNREKLQKALQRVGSIIGSRSMLPVLGNVLIQAEEGFIRLTAFGRREDCVEAMRRIRSKIG